MSLPLLLNLFENSPYKAYITYLFNNFFSLPLQQHLYRYKTVFTVFYRLYRYKIAYYLNHTGFLNSQNFLKMSLQLLHNFF